MRLLIAPFRVLNPSCYSEFSASSCVDICWVDVDERLYVCADDRLRNRDGLMCMGRTLNMLPNH